MTSVPVDWVVNEIVSPAPEAEAWSAVVMSAKLKAGHPESPSSVASGTACRN